MRSKELWFVQENHATVKPDSSLTRRGIKAYSESRTELRNLQILKRDDVSTFTQRHFQVKMNKKKLFEYKYTRNNFPGNGVLYIDG